MKKILLFSLSYYPRVSGAEIAVKEVTDRISPTEVTFQMITMRFSVHESAQEQVGNVRVYRVGGGGSYFSKIIFIPRAALLAARLHKKEKFDALWALMSYMVLPVVLLRLGGVRLPYVLTLQDGDPFEKVFGRPHIRPFRFLLTKGFRGAKVVHVISSYLAGWMQKVGYSGPVEVIPNGVDYEFFNRAAAKTKELFWTDKAISGEGVKLITTSRLVHKNAVDVIIRALAKLPPYVQFVILGQGVEKKKLEVLALELGVAGRVHFVGEIQNSAISDWLHASDIFVRPSRSEGMGTSFVEAMAAGLPVIATQEGGIADFLFDAKRNPDKEPTGFAVDVDSPEQIAAMVKDMLENPDKVKKVVENAKAMVAQKYDWDLIAKNMQEKVFNRIQIE